MRIYQLAAYHKDAGRLRSGLARQERSMSVGKRLGLLGLDTITATLSPVADVVTLGGVLSDKEDTYTGDAVRHVGRDLQGLREELEA